MNIIGHLKLEGVWDLQCYEYKYVGECLQLHRSPEAASDVAESHEKDQNNPANGQICRNGKLVNKEGVDKKGTSARESEATGALLATMMAVSDSESNADGTVTEPRDNSQSMRTRTGPVLDAHGRRSSGKILQVPEKNSRGYYHLDMKAVLGKGHTYNQPPVQEKTHPDSTTTASADEPVSIPLSKFRSDEEQVQYITAHNQRLVARSTLSPVLLRGDQEHADHAFADNQKEADAGSKKRKNSMMAGLETAAKRPRGDLFPPGMKECIESKPEGVDDVEENGP